MKSSLRSSTTHPCSMTRNWSRRREPRPGLRSRTLVCRRSCARSWPRCAPRGRASLPVQIESTPAERLPAPVEAAAYFVASEALANVAKHAHASHVTIAVIREGRQLVVEISDDGVGGADSVKGGGLLGLRDRVE